MLIDRTFFRLNNSSENNSGLNDSKLPTGLYISTVKEFVLNVLSVSLWSWTVVENILMFSMFSPYSFDTTLIDQYKESIFARNCLLKKKIPTVILSNPKRIVQFLRALNQRTTSIPLLLWELC